MSDRIELDPKMAAHRISSDVLQEICRHALEVVPEECCGFVIGDDQEPFARVVRISNIMTKRHLEDPKAFPRDARFAYYMAETEYQRALEEADARSERVNAIYHSHVDEDCYLSADDLAFAVHPLYPLPEASQIVVSVLAERIKTMGFFERIDGEGTPFRGRLLEAATG